jgi:colicin import membrane protein
MAKFKAKAGKQVMVLNTIFTFGEDLHETTDKDEIKAFKGAKGVVESKLTAAEVKAEKAEAEAKAKVEAEKAEAEAKAKTEGEF